MPPKTTAMQHLGGFLDSGLNTATFGLKDLSGKALEKLSGGTTQFNRTPEQKAQTKVANVVGELGGMLIPFGAAYRGTKAIADTGGKAVSRVLDNAISKSRNAF